MVYVETVVNSPGGRQGTFTYSTEPADGVAVGSLRVAGRLDLAQARALLAQHHFARQTDRIVGGLVQRGLVQRATTVRPAAIRPRQEWYVRLGGSAADAADALGSLARAPRQRRLL